MRAAVLAIALFLVAAPARADDATTAVHELYERGVRYFNLGQYEDALDAFQAAYGAKLDPELLFNIAQCQRKLHRRAAAADSYRAFLANAPPGADRETAQRMAREMDEEEAPRRAPAPAVAPLVPPPLEIAARPPPRRSPLWLAGVALTGAGAGVALAGIPLAAVAKSEGDRAWHPADGVYNDQADARHERLQAGEIACFVVGGAAVATGVTLWAIGSRR